MDIPPVWVVRISPAEVTPRHVHDTETSGTLGTATVASLWGSGADGVEGGQGLVVGVGQGVEVFLGGLDLGVAHALHD